MKDKLWFFASVRRQMNSHLLRGPLLQPELGRSERSGLRRRTSTSRPTLDRSSPTSTAASRGRRAQEQVRLLLHASAARRVRRPRDVSPESVNYFKFDNEPADHRSAGSRRSPAGCSSTRASPRTAKSSTTRCGTTIRTASGARSSPSPSRAGDSRACCIAAPARRPGRRSSSRRCRRRTSGSSGLGHLRDRLARAQSSGSGTLGAPVPARARHRFERPATASTTACRT